MLKEKLKFSIIVPVYKAQQYLRTCIDSIMGQTYPNFELILVDDGSPDLSLQICMEYEQKDNRVKVVHKENRGVSAARNEGLKIAKGDYIIFVDSDDYVKSNLLEEIEKNISKNQADIVVYGFEKVVGNKTTVNIPNINEFSKSTDCFYTNVQNFDNMINNHWSVVVWNKAIKKSVIKQNFDENIHFSEDLLFNSQFFTSPLKMSVIEQALYIYVLKDVSLSKKCDKNSINNLIDLNIRIHNNLAVEYASLHNVNELVLRVIIKDLCIMSNLKSKEIQNILENTNSDLLKKTLKNTYSKNPMMKMCKYLLLHNRYKTLMFFIRLYRRIKNVK